MRRIFGMAKSGLKPHGGTVRNLELDFLRLIYAVERSKARGEDAVGYMCVLNQAMSRSIDNWIAGYEVEDIIRVVVPELDDTQSRRLEEEKDRNRAGNRVGANAELASANFGRDPAESALENCIGSLEQGVVKSEELFLGINWDFHGVINTENVIN